MISRILVLLLSSSLLIFGGCGYSTGYKMPDGVHRLSVPTFANETFPLRREIEFDLTRAVRQELEIRTDIELVAFSRADHVLEGTVVSFSERVITEGPFDEVQESSINVTARVRLTRTGSGEVILDRKISDHAPFSVLRGQSIETARAEAINQIARRIVSELEVW